MSILLLYLVWSLAFPIAKLLSQYADPLLIVALRSFIASFLLFATLLFGKEKKLIPPAKGLLPLFGYAFFGVYLSNYLEYAAIRYLSSAKVCLIYSFSPICTAFLSYIHFNEKLSFQKWIGILISLIGILPILSHQEGAEELLKIHTFLSWPSFWMLLAVISSVYGWMALKKAVETIPIQQTHAYAFLLGGFLALASSSNSSLLFNLSLDQWLPFIGWTLLLVLISNLFCSQLYTYLLKRYSVTLLSLFGLTSPLFTSFYGFFLLNEPLSISLLPALGLISLGLYIVHRAESFPSPTLRSGLNEF